MLSESIFNESKMSAKSALREGFEITMEDVEGDITTRRIRGLDIPNASQNLVIAKQAMDNMQLGKTNATQMREILISHQTPNPNMASSLLDPELLGVSPIGRMFDSNVGSVAKKGFSERVLAYSNRLMAAGKSAIPLAKPLLLGSAVSLGLAALLSRPASFTTPPELNIDSTGKSLGNADLKANMNYQIHPDTKQVQGSPETPNISTNTARITNDYGYKININSSNNDNIDINRLTTELRNQTGNHSRINSTIKDKRSSINQQRIARMLNEE